MSLTDYVIMPGADYQGICDAVRAKNGQTGIYKSGELATAIEAITGGGGTYQSKNIIMNESAQTITPDEGYDALTSVNVEDRFKYVYNAERLFMVEHLENSVQTFDLRNAMTLSYAFYRNSVEELTIYVSDKLTRMDYFIDNTYTSKLKKIRIIGDLSNCAYYKYAFSNNALLEEIDADINMSKSINGNYSNNCFLNLVALKKVRFVPNTICNGYISINNSPLLADDSLVSLANGLMEGVTGQTLTLHATPKEKCSSIIGSYSLDETETYHIFSVDDNGDMTLSEFITEVKGWTLA